MPRLYLEPIPGSRDEPTRVSFAFVDPGRSGIQFWDALRLTTILRIGHDGPRGSRDTRRRVQAIVDTGAPLTVFPDQVWSDFPPSVIRFLDVPPGGSPQTMLVSGIRCPFRLGWIWVGVEDKEWTISSLPAQRVLAQFAEDGGRMKSNVLVGLSHSVLTGRRLVRETTLEADESDPAELNRRRRTFGQVWRLTAV